MPHSARASNARAPVFPQFPPRIRRSIEDVPWLMRLSSEARTRLCEAIASAMVAINGDQDAMAWVRKGRRRAASVLWPVDLGGAGGQTMVTFSRPVLVRLQSANRTLVLFQEVGL